jgi:glycosyltransferase involved in cell wall biosynthesis
MNILVFWESAAWGGVESHLLELISGWPESRDRFTLIYNRGNKGYERVRDELDALGVSSISMLPLSYSSLSIAAHSLSLYPLIRPMLFLLRPLLFYFTQLQLYFLFRRKGPFDVILANNGGYPGAWGVLSALPASRMAGIPVRLLLVHHAATPPAPFMSFFENLIDRKVMKTSSAIVCISHATRNELLKHRSILPEIVRIRVIHNSYSVRKTLPAPPELKDLFSTLRKNGEILIGIMGRIEAYKGHEDLIFALSRLPLKQRKRFKAVFIGTGSSNEIERLQYCSEALDVAKQVVFLGYLNFDALAIARELDIMAMLTRSFEGFGLTIAEAMVVGTPVLATRVGAVEEFVDDSVGYLVAPSSPNEVAEALLDFLNENKRWEIRSLKASGLLQNKERGMHEKYHQLIIDLKGAKNE